MFTTRVQPCLAALQDMQDCFQMQMILPLSCKCFCRVANTVELNSSNKIPSDEFTKQQFPLNNNRRGIGFDKPEPELWDEGPTCKSASAESYGHTGFTGTIAWADPKYNLVYIFLSNRTYPSAQNTKLIKMRTRKEIQQVIYDAVLNAENSKIKKEELGSAPVKVQ